MDQASKINPNPKIFISNPNLFLPQKTNQTEVINFSTNFKKTPTKPLLIKRHSNNFNKNNSIYDKCRAVMRTKKSNRDANHDFLKNDSNCSEMIKAKLGNGEIHDKIDLITKTSNETKIEENLSGLNDLSGIEVINLSDEEMNDDMLCLIEDSFRIKLKNDYHEKSNKKVNHFEKNSSKRTASTKPSYAKIKLILNYFPSLPQPLNQLQPLKCQKENI